MFCSRMGNGIPITCTATSQKWTGQPIHLAGSKNPLTLGMGKVKKMHVECIVNTANPYSVIGDGCDSAIYHAAGSSELLAYRNTLGEFKKCDVFLTKIFLYIHKNDD